MERFVFLVTDTNPLKIVSTSMFQGSSIRGGKKVSPLNLGNIAKSANENCQTK